MGDHDCFLAVSARFLPEARRFRLHSVGIVSVNRSGATSVRRTRRKELEAMWKIVTGRRTAACEAAKMVRGCLVSGWG